MLRNLIITTFIIIGVCYFSGCSQHYGPGNLGVSMNYVPTPGYEGKDTSSLHIGGSYGSTFATGGYDLDDRIDIGQVTLSRSKVKKGHTLSYGGLGYLGRYDAQYEVGNATTQAAVDGIGGGKSLWGLGAFGEYQVNIHGADIDYRIIGINASVYYEGGQYFDYRKDLVNLIDELPFAGEVSNLNDNPISFGIGLSSEIVIKTDYFHLGLRADGGFLKGGVGAHAVVGGKFFITRNRWTLSTQVSASEYMDGYITGFGLHYRIK